MNGPRGIGPCVRLLCAWAFGLWIAGCSADDTTAPKNATNHVNEDEPNANGRITSETILGDPAKGTTLWELEPADDGSLGLLAYYNASAGVGVLEAGGALRWFKALTYSPRNAVMLPSTAIAPRGVILVGALDTDSDGDSEQGSVALYSSSGTLLAQAPFTSDSSDVWFNGIALVDDSTFVATGTARRFGVEHPLATKVKLSAPGVLSLGPTTVLHDLNGRFGTLVLLPSSAGEVAFATTSLVGVARAVHRLRAPWPGFDPVTVEWSHEVAATIGPWESLTLAQSGGNLYLAGAASDTRKPPPSLGGQWSSGVVLSYSGAGDLRWSTVDSLTRHSDGFLDVAIGPDAAYATGGAGRYVYRSDTSAGTPREQFGYGLVAKVDLNTGRVLGNFTLGSHDYSSLLNAATWNLGGLQCGGWTQFDVSNGPYRGWLVGVDASVTIAAAQRKDVAPAGRGTSAVRPRGDRPSEDARTR